MFPHPLDDYVIPIFLVTFFLLAVFMGVREIAVLLPHRQGRLPLWEINLISAIAAITVLALGKPVLLIAVGISHIALLVERHSRPPFDPK
jgi:hypothetical protein